MYQQQEVEQVPTATDDANFEVPKQFPESVAQLSSDWGSFSLDGDVRTSSELSAEIQVEEREKKEVQVQDNTDFVFEEPQVSSPQLVRPQEARLRLLAQKKQQYFARGLPPTEFRLNAVLESCFPLSTRKEEVRPVKTKKRKYLALAIKMAEKKVLDGAYFQKLNKKKVLKKQHLNYLVLQAGTNFSNFLPAVRQLSSYYLLCQGSNKQFLLRAFYYILFYLADELTGKSILIFADNTWLRLDFPSFHHVEYLINLEIGSLKHIGDLNNPISLHFEEFLATVNNVPQNQSTVDDLICFEEAPSSPRFSVQSENVAVAIPLHGEFFPTPMFRSDRVVNQSMIKYEELRLGAQIGVGHSGVVYKGIWRGMAVAVKEAQNITENQLEEFRREIDLTASIPSHANILKYNGWSQNQSKIFLVTEFMEGGSLDEYIANDQARYTLHEMLKILSGLAAGLMHLAKEDIVHRDIAPRNILITKDLVPRISDFGLSKYLEMGSSYQQTNWQEAVPLRWMAIESLSDGKFSSHSDMWSFGVVVWQIIHKQKVPYKDIANAVLFAKLENGHRLKFTAEKIPPWLVTLASRCWEVDPEKRPTAEEVFNELSSHEIPNTRSNYSPMVSPRKSAEVVHKAPEPGTTVDESLFCVGEMDRDGAEHALQQCGPDTYLVRYSHRTGTSVLSCLKGGKMYHLVIEVDDMWGYRIKNISDDWFPTLGDLVGMSDICRGLMPILGDKPPPSVSSYDTIPALQ